MSGVSDKTMFEVAAIQQPYTTIPNATLRDMNLTLEARGLLACMLSHAPGWKVNINWMKTNFGIGRDKVYRILNELIDTGYCRRVQGQDEHGAWQHIRYQFVGDQALFEAQNQPRPEKPEAGENKAFSPRPENPYTGKPDTVNTETLRKKKSKNQQQYEKNNKSAQDARSGGGGDHLKKGNDGKKENPPLKSASSGKPAPGMFDDVSLAETDEGKAFRHYCEIAQRCGLKMVRVLTDQRRTAIRAVMGLHGVWPDGDGGWRKGEMGLEGLVMALDAVERTPWMLGKNDRAWKINLDTLLSGDRVVKLLEDFYSGDAGSGSAGYPSADKLAKEPRSSWESRMRIWDEKGRAVWPTSWGPAPDRKGCGVPSDLLAKYGVKDAA